ncbi:MAG: DUF1318 domain-containing protein [Chromatiales bacterium]|nr:DUF1318 domain-containing protein [Chromatiales bacterium]
MFSIQRLALAGLVFVSSACVTINVYFPSAEAEKAAREIVEDILRQRGPGETGAVNELGRAIDRLLAVVFPAAHAADAKLDIDSPEIRQVRASMRTRHAELLPFYESGAVGFTDDALIAVRDAAGLELRDRARVNKLVDGENADRQKLYRVIASANNHPEWAGEIQRTFAAEWVREMRKGWWLRSGGSWKQR